MISQPMRSAQSLENLTVHDLGRMAYAPCLELQRETNRAVAAGERAPTLLLVEHDPVITVTPRKGVENHLLTSRGHLAKLGIDVQPTDRGGDITYHGPGQLVVYPILRMGPLGLNLGRYMRLLERVVIDTVASFGVAGRRDPGATGVWVESHSGLTKLCAMGVRIRKNTTMHGLALNISPNLSHFETIVPCGLVGRSVTSLHELLGEACPAMDAVKRVLTRVMREHLDDLATDARP